jgi:hypothetical protein
MPLLQPLPIMGLGYRWSLDFAGPLPITPRHNKYVLVMIEHFSKWIELVALPDKFCEGAAYSFLDRMLSRFGAPAEVPSIGCICSVKCDCSFLVCVTVSL